MWLPAPEETDLARVQFQIVVTDAVMDRSFHHVIHLNLCMPVGSQHDRRVIVEELQCCRHAFDAARAGLINRSFGNLTFRQIDVPFLRDRFPAVANLPTFAKERQLKKGGFQCALNFLARRQL